MDAASEAPGRADCKSRLVVPHREAERGSLVEQKTSPLQKWQNERFLRTASSTATAAVAVATAGALWLWLWLRLWLWPWPWLWLWLAKRHSALFCVVSRVRAL